MNWKRLTAGFLAVCTMGLSIPAAPIGTLAAGEEVTESYTFEVLAGETPETTEAFTTTTAPAQTTTAVIEGTTTAVQPEITTAPVETTTAPAESTETETTVTTISVFQAVEQAAAAHPEYEISAEKIELPLSLNADEETYMWRCGIMHDGWGQVAVGSSTYLVSPEGETVDRFPDNVRYVYDETTGVFSCSVAYNLVMFADESCRILDKDGTRLFETARMGQLGDGIVTIVAEGSQPIPDYYDGYSMNDAADVICFADQNGKILYQLPALFGVQTTDWMEGTIDARGIGYAAGLGDHFSEGLIAFGSNYCFTDTLDSTPVKGTAERVGFMDVQGNIVIPQMYAGAGQFGDGLANVADAETGKVGYINKSNETVIPFIYDQGYAFFNGRAIVQKDGKWGLIDTDGNTVLDFVYSNVLFESTDGLYVTGEDYKYAKTSDNGETYTFYATKYRVIDEDGTEIISELALSDITNCYDGYLYGVDGENCYRIRIQKKAQTFTPGDLSGDGKVDAGDATDLLIAAAQLGAEGTCDLTETQLAAADVNGDGRTDAGDATEILQFAAYAGAGGELKPADYFAQDPA